MQNRALCACVFFAAPPSMSAGLRRSKTGALCVISPFALGATPLSFGAQTVARLSVKAREIPSRSVFAAI
jgi:hypothetical protein